MKHYAPMANGDEYDLLDPKTRRYVGHSEGFLAETKRRYRKRERAALKHMVAELVVEELGNDLPYWDAELDKVVNEWHRLMDERRAERDDYEWYGAEEPDERWYDQRIGEVEKQVAVAYREWNAAA